MFQTHSQMDAGNAQENELGQTARNSAEEKDRCFTAQSSFLKRSAATAAALWLAAACPAAQETLPNEEPKPEIRIAVQSLGETTAVVETIATTLDHLRDVLADEAFILEYYDRAQLRKVVQAFQKPYNTTAESASFSLPADAANTAPQQPPLFFITDAVSFSQLEAHGSVQALASMKSPQALDAAHTTGAAFIVRADRTDLESLASLQGAAVEATEATAAESWLIGMHEIRRIFGDEHFFGTVRFAGPPAEQVIHDIAAGRADVAS